MAKCSNPKCKCTNCTCGDNCKCDGETCHCPDCCENTDNKNK